MIIVQCRLLNQNEHLKTKYQWSLSSEHWASWCFYIRGNIGPYRRYSKSQGRWYSWVKPWVSKIGCKWSMWTITKLFELVAKEGFLASWIIIIIQMIFKFGEKHSQRNSKTIVLGTMFGNLYGSNLPKKITNKQINKIDRWNQKGSKQEDKHVLGR